MPLGEARGWEAWEGSGVVAVFYFLFWVGVTQMHLLCQNSSPSALQLCTFLRFAHFSVCELYYSKFH